MLSPEPTRTKVVSAILVFVGVLITYAEVSRAVIDQQYQAHMKNTGIGDPLRYFVRQITPGMSKAEVSRTLRSFTLVPQHAASDRAFFRHEDIPRDVVPGPTDCYAFLRTRYWATSIPVKIHHCLCVTYDDTGLVRHRYGRVD